MTGAPVLGDRRTYLGGPGAATVLGVNAYQSPLALWQYLTGRDAGPELSEAMRTGQRLEPAVLAYAGEVIGTEVRPGPFVRDVAHPFGGHLDGITAAGDVVEAKTARTRKGWGEPGTAEIPAGYAAQALWYLGLVPGARIAWVPVLFGGLEFALYRIERDDALIAAMRELCAAWWREHVEADVPPPPSNGADVAALFPRDAGTAVEADDAVYDAWRELHDCRRELAALEARRDALEGRIKCAMGEAATLTRGGDTIATWRLTKPSARFDQAAFRAANPDLYTQFCVPAASRRFLLRSAHE